MNDLLENFTVLNLTINLPGPLAGSRLAELGAKVEKWEPPEGDPLHLHYPNWYEKVTRKQSVHRCDLKSSEGFQSLCEKLKHTDLLITSMRPMALKSLNLTWDKLQEVNPSLCHLSIVGYPPPNEDKPGHDLTYLAKEGLLTDHELPRLLICDYVSSEVAVQRALAMLLKRTKNHRGSFHQMPMSSAILDYADPYKFGATRPNGVLGGGMTTYNIYETKEGAIAIAAIEPKLVANFQQAAQLDSLDAKKLSQLFLTKTDKEWEDWGQTYDVPIVALR